MGLGHGLPPGIDARNYKAVERCLPRDGDCSTSVSTCPGRSSKALGAPSRRPTIELCRDGGGSFLVDAQAWRFPAARHL